MSDQDKDRDSSGQLQEAEAQFVLGCQHLQAKNLPAAFECMREALRLNPNIIWCRWCLQRLRWGLPKSARIRSGHRCVHQRHCAESRRAGQSLRKGEVLGASAPVPGCDHRSGFRYPARASPGGCPDSARELLSELAAIRSGYRQLQTGD